MKSSNTCLNPAWTLAHTFVQTFPEPLNHEACLNSCLNSVWTLAQTLPKPLPETLPKPLLNPSQTHPQNVCLNPYPKPCPNLCPGPCSKGNFHTRILLISTNTPFQILNFRQTLPCKIGLLITWVPKAPLHHAHKSDEHPRSINKLTLNEPAVRKKLDHHRIFFLAFWLVYSRYTILFCQIVSWS